MEILLVIQVIVVVAMVAVILVQKSNSDGFTGSSSPNSFLTGRASANLFTRITSILAAIFIINSLVLAYIASHSERASAILENAADEAAKENNGKTNNSKGSLSDLENKMKNMRNQPVNSQPANENKPQKSPADENTGPSTTPSNMPAVPASE